ncbi:isocitrate lyase/PEP mutase family protein [Kordiimonas aestuarii]|uniref:isocitrate lyase/PEP mutase family protein n=1 Tax=Kordiimonas aestuarii TaxID=1005925 RepID=UPI0021CFA110|nr:isocitrate lyase/phosphoenolpyruvate mutase family protein [Kordiimonas aestuarii]
MDMVEKGQSFRDMHYADRAFIIPNPYDAGTAKLLATCGFQALATTSAGYAFSAGRPDNNIGRDEMLQHSAMIVQATDLPVSADLENGFHEAPEEVARTIAMAAEVGLVGCSIEDSVNTGPNSGQYDLGFAKERIIAAVEVARTLPFRFTLTARAENFLVGNPDIADVVARLQAYEDAGADVLYAPGLTSETDIRTVVESVGRPVNVVMGLSGVQLGQAELSVMGVKRISTGSSLARAALGAFLRASNEMRDHGTFRYADDAVPFGEINTIFS